VTVAGYARQAATFEYCIDGTTIANAATIQWPMATQDWGNINQVQLWNVASGGTATDNLMSTLPAVDVVWVQQYSIARMRAAGGIFAAQTVTARPYGVGLYGTERYMTYTVLEGTASALLEVLFGAVQMCEPGTWAAAAGCEAGSWTAPSGCEPGSWAPGPFSNLETVS
jgi:hypothetical protein